MSALIAAALLAGPATSAPRLPDAAVQPSSIRFTKYAFQGEPESKIRFCDRTFNHGNARTPRRLHNKMILLRPDGYGFTVATRDTTRLAGRSPVRPGGSAVFHSHGGCGTGDNTPLTLPTGVYSVRICTDLRVPDSNRANNCRVFRKAFVVAKRTWTAAITGTSDTVVGDVESWTTSGFVFTFAGRDAAKRFVYNSTAGSVSYRYAQTINTGCNRNGAGTDASPGAQLLLDYVREGYYAFGRTTVGFSYPTPSLCQNDLRYGPDTPVFLDTGIGAGTPRPLPYGSDQIAGTRTDVDTRFDWIFR